MDLAVQAGHRVKLKESEKKYLDLAWELEKLWNMKVTVTPIIIGALVTVNERLLKGLEDLEIRGRLETILTTALLRSVRILRRVPETWGDFESFKIQRKSSSLANQTCRTLLEKQGGTHKRCTLMDPHTWPCKSGTTSTNIHSAALWEYGMLSWRPA